MQPQSEHSTLQVQGEGQVQLRPDTAWLSLSVVTEAKSASEAAQQNGARLGQVVAQLRRLGLDEHQLQTQGFNLYPVYSQSEPPTIIGYRAENTPGFGPFHDVIVSNNVPLVVVHKAGAAAKRSVNNVDDGGVCLRIELDQSILQCKVTAHARLGRECH